MQDFSMKINDKNGKALCTSKPCGNGISMVHTTEYKDGDIILLEVGENHGFYFVKLDETMPETLIYIEENKLGGVMFFPVPILEQLVCYSPKSFFSNLHVISARKAQEHEISIERNLALNPYDGHKIKGFFPHASANVETRNEAVFAARNAIDGVYENASHGKYPYSSWGINQDSKAAITIDFGKNVEIYEARITLRADFPHDNYWIQGELVFSDGSNEVINLEKTEMPQIFLFEKRITNKVIFTNLIKSEEKSPFPALTQIELWGIYK